MFRDWLLLALRIASPILLYAFLVTLFFRLRQSSHRAPTAVILRLLDVPDTSWVLVSDATLGRNRRNTIVIQDEFVSARHARLSYRNDGWWLEDLHSTNGTRLNDKPLTMPTPVYPGDVVTIGTHHYQFEQG